MMIQLLKKFLFLFLVTIHLWSCGTADESIDDAKKPADGAPGEKGEAGTNGSNGAPGSNGATGATGATGPAGISGATGASWRALGLTATSLTAVGGDPLTSSGTAAASPQSDAMYVQHTSSATISAYAGVSQTFTQTRGQYRPKLTALIRTDSSIAGRRIWVALADLALIDTDGAGMTTSRYVGVRYSTNSGDTNWRCGSGNGTNAGTIDTGVPVTINTSYLIEVDWSTNGSLVCTVNGVSVTKTTNLDSTQTSDLGVLVMSQTLAAVAIVHRTSFIKLRYTGNDL